MTKQMMIIIILFIYIFVRSVLIEPNSLVIKKYDIESEGIAGIRVAFISDVHLKKNNMFRLESIIKATNGQSPDIVLFGGDFANGSDKNETISPYVVADKLKKIKVEKYAVLGTDDIKTDEKEYREAFNLSGISVLENKSKVVYKKGKKFYIIGLTDISKGSPDIASAFVDTTVPRIVLTHNPDVYYDILDDVDLILAGHTHGGQFIFPLTPPLFVDSKYGNLFAGGKVGGSKNPMIVSRGIGTSILPVRFNCPPEIVIINFVKPVKEETKNAE